MRPLFLEFEHDPVRETIDDQFMFGPEVLVAPVLFYGANERKVYLPAGATWVDAWNGATYTGGQWLDSFAPLATIPVFLKTDSELTEAFRSLS